MPQQFGATYVIASPPAGEADYDLGAARYRELLEAGESIGVQPAMEFLGFVGQLKYDRRRSRCNAAFRPVGRYDNSRSIPRIPWWGQRRIDFTPHRGSDRDFPLQ